MPFLCKFVPDNPFMVSSVFEDLRYRWNRCNIAKEAHPALCLCLESLQEYPWAGVTLMVPREADVDCSLVSRATGSAILSNDSDLLLHELGPHGCVLILDSVEMHKWDRNASTEAEITALRARPSTLAARLGIADILYFAYELTRDPTASFSDLVRRSRGARGAAETADYAAFVETYRPTIHAVSAGRHFPQHFDARVSELFLQCKCEDERRLDGILHMYLSVINDDHARRCAWEAGLGYRRLAYSVINTIRPITRRFAFVDEYVRKGGRIAVDRITLLDEDTILSEMQSLSRRLSLARAMVDDNIASPRYWRLFVLGELRCHRMDKAGLLGTDQLERYLRLGYVGQALEWTEVHLMAQTQALLYSLRILKQALAAKVPHGEVASRVKSMLSGLPPLHVLMKSRAETSREFGDESATGELVRAFFRYCEQCAGVSRREDAIHEAADEDKLGLHECVSGECVSGITAADCRVSANIYEFLKSS